MQRGEARGLKSGESLEIAGVRRFCVQEQKPSPAFLCTKSGRFCMFMHRIPSPAGGQDPPQDRRGRMDFSLCERVRTGEDPKTGGVRWKKHISLPAKGARGSEPVTGDHSPTIVGKYLADKSRAKRERSARGAAPAACWREDPAGNGGRRVLYTRRFLQKGFDKIPLHRRERANFDL